MRYNASKKKSIRYAGILKPATDYWNCPIPCDWLVALVLHLKDTEFAGSPLAIDREEWIGKPEDPRERFPCPNCYPEDVLKVAGMDIGIVSER